MSVWTTKSLSRPREYIVLQHTLRGINYSILGVKFRDGYAVIEKSGKTYSALKKIPVLRAARELPLIILKDLKFITRTQDVNSIFGKDVYNHYLAALEKDKLEKAIVKKEEEVVKHLEENIKCKYSLESGELCKQIAMDYSPSHFCGMHLLDDIRLKDFDIEIPTFMPKAERKELRKKIIAKLELLKSQGKF